MAGISKFIKSIETDDDGDEPVMLENPLDNDPMDIPKPPKQEKPIVKHTEDTVDRPAPSNPSSTQPTPSPSLPTYDAPDFGWIKIVVVLGLLAWIVSAAILTFSVLNVGQNYQNYTALQWAGLAMMFIGPAVIIGVGAYALRQLANISSRAHRLEVMVEQFSQPDLLAAEKSESLAAAVAQQIDFVNAKLSEALGRTSALDEVLKTQAAAINNSNKAAEETSNSVGKTLEHQKEALLVISRTFDDRMEALSQMISGHGEELANATRIAEQKIKEARISVEGATEKISNVSDVVRSNTVEAASTLTASHDEITSLGDIIRQRSSELDEVYKRHANDLTAMIEHLREEQKNLGANMEETLVKMRDLSLSAQASAESLADASSAGKDTVQALAESASLADDAVKTRFAEMEQMVRYSTDHAQNISDLASKRVQDSLEHTRTEIARIERDMAALQDKLHHSNAATTIDLVPEGSKFQEKTSKRAKRSSLHLKPLSDERAVVEAHEKDKKNEKSLETAQDSEPADAPVEEPVVETASEDDALELQVEAPAFEDLQAGSLETDPIIAAIRPVAEYESKKKEKTGFSFKGLFGRNAESNEDTSLNIVTPSNKGLLREPGNSPPQNDSIVAVLNELGFSPNVIVDDGCVIEAANNRAASGHEAMSKGIIARLTDPIRHFSHALSTDTDLSTKIIEFATQFDHGVEKLAGDREAIRTRLESEDGRAYILCDGALNYGRV